MKPRGPSSRGLAGRPATRVCVCVCHPIMKSNHRNRYHTPLLQLCPHCSNVLRFRPWRPFLPLYTTSRLYTADASLPPTPFPRSCPVARAPEGELAVTARRLITGVALVIPLLLLCVVWVSIAPQWGGFSPRSVQCHRQFLGALWTRVPFRLRVVRGVSTVQFISAPCLPSNLAPDVVALAVHSAFGASCGVLLQTYHCLCSPRRPALRPSISLPVPYCTSLFCPGGHRVAPPWDVPVGAPWTVTHRPSPAHQRRHCIHLYCVHIHVSQSQARICAESSATPPPIYHGAAPVSSLGTSTLFFCTTVGCPKCLDTTWNHYICTVLGLLTPRLYCLSAAPPLVG